jgi:hypothetical protein
VLDATPAEAADWIRTGRGEVALEAPTEAAVISPPENAAMRTEPVKRGPGRPPRPREGR